MHLRLAGGGKGDDSSGLDALRQTRFGNGFIIKPEENARRLGAASSFVELPEGPHEVLGEKRLVWVVKLKARIGTEGDYYLDAHPMPPPSKGTLSSLKKTSCPNVWYVLILPLRLLNPAQTRVISYVDAFTNHKKTKAERRPS